MGKRNAMIFCAVLCLGCSMFSGCLLDGKKNELKIASWNVQTFFDANAEGTEYSEFLKSKTWGAESYRCRLERLCSVIRKINADIFVMEEIENAAVLQDIGNFLSGEWNSGNVYRYACFAKSDGGSIGCGVISKVPLEWMRLHSIDVRTEQEKMPRTRPVAEIEVNTSAGPLRIFVNHWKSKSGGAEKTEKWRNREEGVLAFFMNCALNEGAAVFAIGDFNRDIHDFCRAEGGSFLLRFWHGRLLDGEGVLAACPWFDAAGNLVYPGSYYFKDEWSRIDCIFYAGKIQMQSFFPAVDGSWCSSDFIPQKYSLWNGSGYSDHLPIVCRVRILDDAE
ncbi:endonuclease/exonuclease/phosphatase family protein [Treponema sp.]|uniref:endonuclease/exonuclease/phosphatase family protein n=1 Tax=Treponema sp. TaxID=166 RepID=UPI003F0DA46B